MTTVVLGLDGAAFELIDPWINDGTLPAFARLVNEGAATGMQSCPPPVTCPNWQCYATGTNPGKVGVYWWEYIDAENQSIDNTSASSDFDGRYYWEYLENECAVINLPTSYPPPDDVNGVHIAGGPGAEQTGYTSPTDVETHLVNEYNYAVHPEHLGDLSSDKPESACVKEIYSLIDTRFDVLKEYIADDNVEFAHLTVFYINVLQHFYWDHSLVRKAWERIDSHVADLLNGDNVETLFVMSDHGSNEIETTFIINAWLEREGYLETTTSLSDVLYRIGLTRERIRPFVARLGIEWGLRRLIPRRLQMLLPDSEGSVTKSAKEHLVNWEESVALASGQGPVYILADSPDERERIRRELISKFEQLTHKGKQIIESAEPAEEVYSGPHLERAPDIVLRQAAGVHIAESIGGGREPFETPDRWRGENKETGLFIAHGPAVDPEANTESMHILDVAPTVLHQLGVAIPSNFDGKVKTELFADGTEPATRNPTTQPSLQAGQATHEQSNTDVSDRLSDLGYLQ